MRAIRKKNKRNPLIHHRYLPVASDPDRHKHCCFNKAERLDLLGYLSGLTSIWNSGKAVFLTREKKNAQESSANTSSDGYRLRDFPLLAGWFVALAGELPLLIGLWA